MIVDSNETITAKYNISVIKVLELKERLVGFSVGKFFLSMPIFWKIIPSIYEKVQEHFIIPKDFDKCKIKGYYPSIIEEGWTYSLYNITGTPIDKEDYKSLISDNPGKKLFIVQAMIPKYCQYVVSKEVINGKFVKIGSELLSVNKILFWSNMSDLEKFICKKKLGLK